MSEKPNINISDLSSHLALQQNDRFEQTQDDKCAFWLEIARWIVIIMAMLAVSSIFLYRCFDRDRNITTYTHIESNTESIDTPYFYFMVYSFNASNFQILDIQSMKINKYGHSNAIKYNFSTFSANNFSYNVHNTEWSVVNLAKDIYGSNTSQILVIPPKKTNGNIIHRGETLVITTSVYDSVENPFMYPGFWWTADSVQDGIMNLDGYNITDAFIKRRGSSLFQSEFSPYDVTTFSQISVTYQLDGWDEKWFGEQKERVTNSFYTVDVHGQVQYTSTYKNYHQNTYAFYLNPTGAGIKTNITEEKDVYFVDAVASIGGYFSPIFATTSVLLYISIFGLSCHFSKFKGFAPNKGLSQVEKRQIKRYLQELGVEMNE